MGCKKAIAVIALAGAITGGFAGTARAKTPAGGQGESGGASTVAPRAGAPESREADVEYFSTQFHRGRSSGNAPAPAAAGVFATAYRCPAFVTWEDWLGGARAHAYVDFHPSDICNGRHVKDAYVRLIRQCGPYYDTGRIYTYTAGSASDTRLYSVSAWIFDSVLWSCNTSTYYGYDYF